MDKLRAFFKVVWQQRFWVLSVVVVIIAAVCWQMASSALDAEFVANKNTIDGKFKEMSDISSKSVHGNDTVNAKEREQAVIIRDEVLKLWQTMYDRQKEGVLTWPPVLGDDFLESVEGKRFKDPIDRNMRQRYREYARERFPRLVEIVQAKKMAETDAFGAMGDGGRGGFDGGRGGRGGGDFSMPMNMTLEDDQPQFDPVTGEEIEPEKYIVQWADQAAVKADLSFAQLPTSVQVWVTQENLWVIETLLHAINETNVARDATRPDNASIRWIMALNVGADAALAAKEKGQVIMPPGAGSADAAAGAVGADGGRGGFGTDATGAGLDPDAALLAGRYIGADGAIIADASTDPGGECRRLPVRMQLFMQQEAIPELLKQCANSALPVEVQRVRINPMLSGAGFDANFTVASPEAMATDGGRGGGFDGGRGGGGFDGGRGGSMATAPTGPQSNGLATVDITGIVYIYNPPDPATLSVPGGDSAEVAATAPGTAAL
jgi:hypothetical protein